MEWPPDPGGGKAFRRSIGSHTLVPIAMVKIIDYQRPLLAELQTLISSR